MTAGAVDQRTTGSSGRRAPLLTVGIWLAATAAICAALQLTGWLFGYELDILGSGTGRTLLIVVAFAVLLTLMTTDQRPLEAFGIRIGRDWFEQLGGAFLVGAAAFGLFHLAGALLGAFKFQPESIGWRWGFKTAEAVVTAVPLAAAQQVIFSGYLLTLLRDATGRAPALLLCGLLFAAAAVSGRSTAELATPATLWLSINLALLTVLSGLIRWRTGSILAPAGILAGALVIRRAVWKSRLVVLDPRSPWADWFALGDDTRAAPLLAGLLTLACGACLWQLARRGESNSSAGGPALSADFKKIVPFSNILALAPLDLWLARLAEARFRIDPIYLPRLAWVLAVSTINTLITLPERILASAVLRHRVPDPVLIVGVHRSGTTHLHNLLALDPQFTVPRNVSVLNPFGALVMGWFITPLLGLFMTLRRPMDAMRVHLFSTQEEEFAIAGMTRLSPYWGFMLPRETARYDRFIYPTDMTPEERAEWGECVLEFLRKLTFIRRRPPLLKSPYNTARVAAFRELFPKTKVVHICRHPYQTYLSNMHLADHGLVAFQVQEPDPQDNYRTRFLDHYRRMEDAYFRDAAALPQEDHAEVRYEDLTARPREEIRRLYAQLGLDYTATFDARLQRYLKSVEGYSRNRHPQLPPAVQAEIDAVMGGYLDQWGYRESAAAGTERRAA